MRLSQLEIERISRKLTRSWLEKNAIELLGTQNDIEKFAQSCFQKELAVEEKLNEAVEELLQQHEKDFQQGNLDRHKMFAMVRKQLAKEKNIVL